MCSQRLETQHKFLECSPSFSTREPYFSWESVFFHLCRMQDADVGRCRAVTELVQCGQRPRVHTQHNHSGIIAANHSQSQPIPANHREITEKSQPITVIRMAEPIIRNRSSTMYYVHLVHSTFMLFWILVRQQVPDEELYLDKSQVHAELYHFQNPTHRRGLIVRCNPLCAALCWS
jgi:hypothetical protein